MTDAVGVIKVGKQRKLLMDSCWGASRTQPFWRIAFDIASFTLQMIAAFAAGTLLNLMPCVLPVIPFKIKALLNETTGDAGSRALSALALLVGSLTFFMALGAAFAGLRLMWGAQFQHPLFRALLALFLLLSAIATFREWSITLPQWVYGTRRGRMMNAYFTGVLGGVLSTPCAGPFLGSTLAFAITLPPAGILFVFMLIALGLAFPYVALLLWPGLMDRLSFSSRIALKFKQFMGFVLLGAALFFAQGLIPEVMSQFGWMALALSFGVWSIFSWVTGDRKKLRPVLVLAVAMAIFSGWREGAFLPATDPIAWQEYSEAALAGAKDRGVPVMVSFMADWCPACQTAKRTTFRSTSLIKQISAGHLTAIQVDLTRANPGRQQLFERYGGNAIPYLVLIDGSGKVFRRITGVVGAETILESINALPRGR